MLELIRYRNLSFHCKLVNWSQIIIAETCNSLKYFKTLLIDITKNSITIYV